MSVCPSRRCTVAGTGIDSAQAAALSELTHRGLCVGVIAGNEDIERLARYLSRRQGPSEGGVEGLHDLRACGDGPGDLLGARAPRGHERRWFRYHHLFAEFLRLRLREAEPERVATLYQRAGAWCVRPT